MRREKNFILILMVLLSCMGLCACSIGRKPLAITVVNRTTYPLEDIRIRETDGKDWGENRLETTLAEGESAKINLGKYTAAELSRGFQVQFYGEDENPVNPNYDPDTATILENGSFLIFTPPDVSVPMFVDSAYNAVVYDKKIVELYALNDDGRGDLIPSEHIPVLMGGALPFTNMQNLRTENNEDGTYRYEDFTQDGQILVVNTAEPTCFVPEVQDLEDYLTACAFALSDTDTYELLSAEENEEYTENLTYPVYIVTYAWEYINGNWWAFDENGYAKTGWLKDEAFGGWFYIDPERGMQTGWVLIDGVWYYFHPVSDGRKGIMYAEQKTPDGYYVDENGAWDGKEK